MKKIFIVVRQFTILCIQLFTCISYALEMPTEKVYPPYPEVWGYDLTDFPAIKEGYGDLDAYRMPDGDIWFLMNYSFKFKNPMESGLDNYKDEKFVILKIFKGEIVELDINQRNEFLELAKDMYLSKVDFKVNFNDGSEIKRHFGTVPKLCFVPLFIHGYHIKTDAKGNAKKFSILGVSPNVEIFEDKALCDVQGAPFFYQRLYLLPYLIDLGDDTFLAYNSGNNLILRFDKDLNTKFKPVYPVGTRNGNFILRNFFVVDRTVIDGIDSKYAGHSLPFNQSVHDELLLYFKEKYK